MAENGATGRASRKGKGNPRRTRTRRPTRTSRAMLLSVSALLLISACCAATSYRLPYPCGSSYTVTQGNNSSTSHTGMSRYAFDFGMPVGSEVVAAASGTVVIVEDSYTEGGADRALMNLANRVVIEHADGYCSLYLHLEHDSAVVTVGQRVFQGQPIAKSGRTGYVVGATGAHLHFQLQQKGIWWEQSVPVRFDDVAGGIPEEGRSYVSGNCPGARTATLLVMDVSGSMAWQWQGEQKIAAARRAALQFIEEVSAAEPGSHMIGVVTFSNSAGTPCALTHDYQRARNTIISLGTVRATNLGAGLVTALQELDQGGTGQRNIILLSDGMTNTGLSRSQILSGPVAEARRKGICIHTVAFGDKGDVDEEFLQRIARESGCGTYNYAATGFQLFGTYIRVRHSMLGSNRIVDFSSGGAPVTLLSGQSAALGAFQLTSPAQELHYTLAWSQSGLMRAILVDPSGRQVVAGYPGTTLYSGNGFSHITVRSPKPGTWRASAAAVTSFPRGVQYYGVASARTGGFVIPLPTPGPTCVTLLGRRFCIAMPDMPTTIIVAVALVALAVLLLDQLSSL